MKLLHEELREFDQNESNYEFECNGTTIELEEDQAKALADMIEYQYIPYPRDEEGKPVHFGDRIINSRKDETTVSSLLYTKGKKDYISINAQERQDLDKPVERAKIEILDMNGQPIKAGDIGFWEKRGLPVSIVDIVFRTKHESDKERQPLLKGYNSDSGLFFWVAPEDFSHVIPIDYRLRKLLTSMQSHWSASISAEDQLKIKTYANDLRSIIHDMDVEAGRISE